MKTILELKDICLKKGNSYILKGIDLKVLPGEKIALMGSSGAGKTSLLSIANGSEKPTYGKVKWKGVPIEDVSLKNKQLITTIWQDLRLIEELNVCQNINTGALCRRNIIWSIANLLLELEGAQCCKILELVGLPKQLLNKSISTLSGGERQRVAIARTLRQKAEFLFADEPLSNLDPNLTNKILDLLLARNKYSNFVTAKTTIISLHRPELISGFTRIIGISKGEVVMDKPRELISKDDIYNLYL